MTRLIITGCSLILLFSGCQSGMPMGGFASGQSPGSMVNQVFESLRSWNAPIGRTAEESPAGNPYMNQDYRVRQAAYQAAEPAQGASAIPEYVTRQDAELMAPVQQPAATQSPGPQHITQNMLRQDPQTAFIADDVRQSPRTATERVLELNAEVTQMRQDIKELKGTLNEMRSENRQLEQTRVQLESRIVGLEQQIVALNRQSQADKLKYAEISQRMQAFRNSRQRQIADLNALVDQLERHLQMRAGNAGFQSSTSPSPGDGGRAP